MGNTGDGRDRSDGPLFLDGVMTDGVETRRQFLGFEEGGLGRKVVGVVVGSAFGVGVEWVLRHWLYRRTPEYELDAETTRGILSEINYVLIDPNYVHDNVVGSRIVDYTTEHQRTEGVSRTYQMAISFNNSDVVLLHVFDGPPRVDGVVDGFGIHVETFNCGTNLNGTNISRKATSIEQNVAQNLYHLLSSRYFAK